MTEKLQQTIQEEVSAMSKEAQQAISSVDWLKIVEEIGKKFDLEEEEVEDLQLETLLVITGTVDMEFYAINIENHVNTTTEKAKNISAEVTQKIFNPILEKLPKNTNVSASKTPIPTPYIQSNIVETMDPRFAKLPDDIEKIIKNSNYQTTLYDIAKSHNLSITQMGSLDASTTNLITGTIHPSEFKKVLMKTLGIPEREVEILVNEINEKVFKKIREKLMTLGVPAPKALDTETLINDMAVLKSHGIEIIPNAPIVPSTNLKQEEVPVISKTQIVQPEKLEITTPIPIKIPETPKIIPSPSLNQKLSGAVQMPKVKSEYGFNNAPVKTGEVQPTVASAPKVTAYKQGQDPYRISPD